jgi:dienelactone hydrolase
MKYILTLAIILAVCSVSARAEIVFKPLEYQQGDVKLDGLAVYDDSLKENRPGVLVVHQWLGPTEYEKGRARQLAELGYVAFVADIYGKDVRPKDQKEAAEQAGKYHADRAALRARATAALEALKRQPMVDQNRVAAIGYCFGGGAVLELARSGADLSGVVSFHGNLDTPNPADAKNIKTKLLVLHGADDPFVKPDQVEAFKKEMDDAKVTYEFIAYPGAVHAFTQKAAGDDPSKGAAYNAKADAESWSKMKEFFARIFPKP